MHAAHNSNSRPHAVRVETEVQIVQGGREGLLVACQGSLSSVKGKCGLSNRTPNARCPLFIGTSRIGIDLRQLYVNQKRIARVCSRFVRKIGTFGH